MQGNAIDHLSRHVIQLGENFHVHLPTATGSRHAAATAVTKTGQQPSQTAVAAMMSHSASTQECYYTATKGLSEAVEGFRVMKNLRQGRSTSSSGRVPFTQEEIEAISSYFSAHIETSTVPAQRECQEFLNEHPIREPKQIRDKIRNLIK